MGRAPCCDKANVKKGPWSPEEDTKLKEYIEKHGTGGNWIALPQKAGLKRCGKSCRLRWLNYLRPNIKHGEFSEEEDRIICSLFANIGSRWSIIAAQLPGRTDNDIKNYWNTKLKKKLMGVFPPSQRKPTPFRYTDHHNPPCPYESLSSSMYKEYNSNYYRTSSTIGHETISVPSNYSNKTSCFATNYIPEMLQTNKDSGLSGSMQMHYYAATEDNLLMFGSEGSSCNSSNGSRSHISHKREIKREDQMGSRQNSMITNTFEENQKYILHDNGIGSIDICTIGTGNENWNVNHWVNMSNGADQNFGENLDYHVPEDIKQVLISSTNCNDDFSNTFLK